MSKKGIAVVALITVIGLLTATSLIIYLTINRSIPFNLPISKEDGNKTGNSQPEPIEKSTLPKDGMFSILLLGIDRRHKSETAFRTDIMILLTVNQNQKKAVLTSVPRDLWVNGGRINSIFVTSGWEAMQAAFEKITGFKPDAYIQSDFEDLVWLIDSFGGVEVELDTAFTDTEYPNDATKTYMTVSFKDGKQIVAGNEALILSRSRHGNNGEGSDFKRMQRQHKILKSMPEAILSPKSVFNPFNISTFYEAVTQRMVTNLTLKDAKILWGYYPNRKSYQVDSFYVDSDYLYNPPMSEYGGAWVLIAKNEDYTPIHTAIKEKMELIPPKLSVEEMQTKTQ